MISGSSFFPQLEAMAVSPLSSFSNLKLCIRERTISYPSPFPNWTHFNSSKSSELVNEKQLNKPFKRLTVFAGAKEKYGEEEEESKESIPTWAKPGSEEPPPWARNEGGNGTTANQKSFEAPFIVYLLASAITAIAAIGSVFEYVNQNPVFGVVDSESIFYAPLLGFFALTGIPTSAFLWFKSVQVANKEAEEQDKRDGFN
ncbi:uncharacterized protein LOC124918883 [Impatiens glandulifera]|uniref:uncharacterized protein LOC124918883 n=1 Tax=Impatiens glandulifera TaxID=253017 RepID=UPI001FB078AB|nr:uncharacterized protein LOC124918883 [Impatiens glandulifera]